MTPPKPEGGVSETHILHKLSIDFDKYPDLIDYLQDLGSVAIAFSGGVDSTFLAYAAREALGDRALAITVDSVYIPRWELQEAKELATEIGIAHQLVKFDTIPEPIRFNPADRCYLCKTVLFETIIATARSQGYAYVIDGSNYDDLQDYRPGMRALRDLKVKSPLLDNRWLKTDIRQASRLAGLETHSKPAYACLLTRIPYDEEICIEDLERIEKAEVYMMGLGFRAIRVRCHGDLARLEVDRNDRAKLFDEDLLDQISVTLKGYGFTYVTMELGGYRMGSFNQGLKK